jgi:SAM-dependent methyltransferase
MSSGASPVGPHSTRPASTSAERTATGHWDQLGRSIEKYRRNTIWCEFRDELHRRWLAERMAWTPGSKVLKTDLFEEAAGAGICPFVTSTGVRCFGIDIAQLLCHLASSGGAVAAACADVQRLPFPDSSFDAVVSLSTLDHFETVAEIRDAVRGIARIVRPGGQLLITLDNPVNPIVRFRNRLPSNVREVGDLVPYFVGPTLDLSSLCSLLEKCGFEVAARDTLMHCPRVVAIRVAGLFSRFGKGALSRLLVKALLKCEALQRWPSAEWTGHFVAVSAIRAK